MYVPAHFEETRLEVLHDLVRESSIGNPCHSGPIGLECEPHSHGARSGT